MPIRGTTRLLGILGNSPAHSYSPAMHNAGIQSLGLDLVYVPFPVEAPGLAPLLEALKSIGFLGVNVTMPHKQAVLPLLDEVSDMSRTMGAVNTIVNRDGKLHGTTTDPQGFLNSFKEAGYDFEGKAVAVLGNGGAARTIAFTLALMTGVRRVALIARDGKKSQALCTEVKAASPACDIVALSFAEYQGVCKDYQVVVNTTPLGMLPNVDATPLPADALEAGQIVYDIIYNPEETRLMREARERGCFVVGGLGMLIHQGLASFEIWTGSNPGPDVFRAGIRRQRELESVSS